MLGRDEGQRAGEVETRSKDSSFKKLESRAEGGAEGCSHVVVASSLFKQDRTGTSVDSKFRVADPASPRGRERDGRSCPRSWD